MNSRSLVLPLLAISLACATACAQKPAAARVQAPSTQPTAPAMPSTKAGAESGNVHVSEEIMRACKVEFNDVDKAPKFDFDQSALLPQDRSVLQQIAVCLTTPPLKDQPGDPAGRPRRPAGRRRIQHGARRAPSGQRATVPGEPRRRHREDRGDLTRQARRDRDRRGGLGARSPRRHLAAIATMKPNRRLPRSSPSRSESFRHAVSQAARRRVVQQRAAQSRGVRTQRTARPRSCSNRRTCAGSWPRRSRTTDARSTRSPTEAGPA